MLSRKERVNIILSKGVTGTVTVNLYNVTVKEAIFSVAQAAGYWVEVRGGDYIILGKETSLDYPGANTQIKTFKVQYSDTKQVADILSKYVSRYGKVTPLVGRNLIVVEDLPGFAERVAKLLEEIDLQPKQVMIEAKILEISLDETERYGIDWKRLFGSPTGTSGSVGTTGLAFGSAAAPGQGLFFNILNKSTEVTTELLCEDGQSIFIGGLIKTGSTVDRQGIPILGDIPLLGRLFSNSVETVSSSETIVIITPYVIREPSEAEKFSEEKA